MLENISKNHTMALMSSSEKQYLHNLVKTLPYGSLVLEVGTFMGGSASIMAHANPDVVIHSIDCYNDSHDRQKPNVNNMLNSVLGDSQPRTLESVSKLVSQYTNIKLYDGFSPTDFTYWNDEIDLYFEDGIHRNPELGDNLNFWCKFIKSGGYLVMHDVRPFLPLNHPSRKIDTELWSSKLLEDGYKKIDHIEGLLILQRT